MNEPKQEAEEEQPWRKTKLSLERPYKGDNGQPIPALLDITPDGQFINEPRQEWDAKLGEQFRRIFIERGVDFFDLDAESRYRFESEDVSKDIVRANVGEDDAVMSEAEKESQDTDEQAKLMTPEKLFNMRTEILPRLHVALGEMSHARDLLSLLLSASAPAPSGSASSGTASLLGGPSAPSLPSLNPALKPGLLTASTVTTQPAILSVQAFDAQLVTGGKDEALRKASDVLRTAAEGIERSSSRSEQYWADALRIRRSNWELIPAPLPLGAATGKGADKTSRDFLIAFGLESSPPVIRRHAIAHSAFYRSPSSQDGPLVFPHRDRTRLRVSLTRKNPSGETLTSHSQIRVVPEDTLSGAIKGAQREIVEKEIFGELIKEAGNLSTASARVSERLIVIEAAQDVELWFELIDEDLVTSSNVNAGSSSDSIGQALCDLIACSLSVFLLRQHGYMKAIRLKLVPGLSNSASRLVHQSQILQPIIELLQYHVFLGRIRKEFLRAISKLRDAGVPVDLRFEDVGETGGVILDALLEGKEKIGGEAVLRINVRHTVRFTFASPSTLTALLPQATITIASIPQLVQLLSDEIERSLLEQICELGIDVCQTLSGSWFLDEMMCRAVGRWEGCVLNFRVKCSDDLSLDCHAHQLLRARPPASAPGLPTTGMIQLGYSTASSGTDLTPAKLLTFEGRKDMSIDFFAWVRRVIEDTLSNS